jgi:SET domain-containing protein
MTKALTGSSLCVVGDSEIEGLGVFVQIDIPEGFFIGTMCLYYRDTQSKSSVLYLSVISTLGRHINHQTNANCGAHNLEEREWVVVSLRDIKAGEELTLNYSLLPWEFNTDVTGFVEHE